VPNGYIVYQLSAYGISAHTQSTYSFVRADAMVVGCAGVPTPGVMFVACTTSVARLSMAHAE
jgi:hypothetical protein